MMKLNSQEKIDKKFKNTLIFAIIILIIVLWGGFLKIYLGGITASQIVIWLIEIIILFFAMFGCIRKKKYGAICGVIISIILILALDIIDIVFGLIYLFYCISLLNKIKENEE